MDRLGLRRKAVPWPPEEFEPQLTKMAEWSAWYSAEPLHLADVYMNRLPDTPQGRFWRKLERDERMQKLHVPMAADLATVSADLLFSESPEIVIPEAHDDTADPGAVSTQERLDEVTTDSGLYSTLVEAAQTAAAMGGVFLKINWDIDFKPFPILSVAQPDAALPEFRWGYLTAVTFFREIERDERNRVYRHLEHHTMENGRGYIVNQLWVGRRDDLGRQISLDDHPDTEHLEPEIDTGIDDLLVRYVPNILPNRLWRDSYFGNSDYQGVEGLLDALDETYTSWMRDVNLAKARIEVPETWLQRTESGRMVVDIDDPVYVAMNTPGDATDADLPAAHQFDIRAQEHRETALELMDRIITGAGYSPQSFGLKIEGRAESGTALRIRERKSMKTRAKKEFYFRAPLEDMLHLLLRVDYEHFGNREVNPELRPQVELADSIQESTSELAETVRLIQQAEAASVETKVRMLHPDWTNDQIEAETDRILRENGMAVEEPEMRV